MSFVFSASTRNTRGVDAGDTSKRLRPSSDGSSGAAAPAASPFPTFPLLPSTAHSSTGFLPLLDAVVARHLQASEAICSASGVTMGNAFHEAAKAACGSFSESARQQVAAAAAEGGVEGVRAFAPG